MSLLLLILLSDGSTDTDVSVPASGNMLLAENGEPLLAEDGEPLLAET